MIPRGTKPGTVFAVEYDPDSQWLAFSTTLTARLLRSNGHVLYATFSRPHDEVKNALSDLGLDITALMNNRLTIDDWYSATLTGGRLEPADPKIGFAEQIETGVRRVRSLKIADLSVSMWKTVKDVSPKSTETRFVFVIDSLSTLTRFNDEKAFVEWFETRENVQARLYKRTTFHGFVVGVHSDWLYKRVEAACDGVIDIKVMERDGRFGNFLRVRSLRGQSHDATWHAMQVNDNGEASLVS